MENAINVGAEDVEEFEEDNKEYFHVRYFFQLQYLNNSLL